MNDININEEMSIGSVVSSSKAADAKQIDDLYSNLYIEPEKSKEKIYDNSKRNLEEFIRLYDKKIMITFIGAGTSKPLGIGDWNELVKALYNESRKIGFKGKFKEEPADWPILTQEIYEFFKKKNSDEYNRIITEQITQKNNTTTLTLIKLILAFDKHLTTNFDSAIENAYKFLEYLAIHFGVDEIKKTCDVRVIPDFTHEQESDGLIYYLHGNSNNNIYILKESDYTKFYPDIRNAEGGSTVLIDLLKYHLRFHSIIFIGFSFRDKYLRELTFDLIKKIEIEKENENNFLIENMENHNWYKNKHFILVDSEILDDYKEPNKYFNEYSIYPIIYKKGQHLFLEKLTEHLSKGINR